MDLRTQLRESLLLHELGDASLPPYDWQVSKREEEGYIIYEFKFQTESGLDYVASALLNPSGAMSVEFDVDGNPRVVTNKGEQYRVMSTMIVIIRVMLKEHPQVSQIMFSPVGALEGDKRRLNLYMRYAEKQLPPGATTKIVGNGTLVRIDLPSSS